MDSHAGQRAYKIIMLIIITALFTSAFTAVAVYNKVGRSQERYSNISVKSNLSEFDERIAQYRNFIDEYYIYDVDEEHMIDYAIKGYFEGLQDDYSEYITKDEMKSYMEEMVGKYVGIGVYIANNTKTNQIVILAPMKGSPAEEVGIEPGDVVLKIDGVEYKGEDLSEATSKLKSEEGTKVKIEILRDDKILEFDVERRKITINPIDTKVLENNIGYIQISSFDLDSHKEFAEKINELKKENIKSLIIDLRNNGGGMVDEATDIIDLFIDKGKTILITKSKGKEEEVTKTKTAKEIDMPIVILVNENTASASEILTVALKENLENVQVVGENTYGKGVIQTVFTLKDGSGIKLTTGEYFSPNHNTIHKVGIEPDYKVEFPEDQSIYRVKEKDDTQLQKAIELLK